MKKVLASILAVLMLVSLCACGGGKDSDTIKIGVYQSLTGANGAGGKQETLGIQYANKINPTIEVNGKTYNIELVISDNESSSDKAASAASKLVAAGCPIVLGSYGSSVCIAGSDTFGNAGIPVIGITCTNPQVTEGNDHYFRICFLDPFQGTVLANFAKDELKATKAYCLGELGNDYDQGLINYFKEAATKLGVQIVGDEDFPKDNSDFNSYITNAKNAGADVIFCPCSTQYAQLIVEQASAQGVTMPLLAGDTWDSNVILNAAKGKGVKVYVSTFYAEGGDKNFEAGLRDWINSDSTAKANNGGDDTIAAVTVMGYDAYMTALKAIQNANSVKAADILKALPGTKITGVSGAIAFNNIGDAIRDTAYIKVANTSTGAWDFVAVQSVK